MHCLYCPARPHGQSPCLLPHSPLALQPLHFASTTTHCLSPSPFLPTEEEYSDWQQTTHHRAKEAAKEAVGGLLPTASDLAQRMVEKSWQSLSSLLLSQSRKVCGTPPAMCFPPFASSPGGLVHACTAAPAPTVTATHPPSWRAREAKTSLRCQPLRRCCRRRCRSCRSRQAACCCGWTASPLPPSPQVCLHSHSKQRQCPCMRAGLQAWGWPYFPAFLCMHKGCQAGARRRPAPPIRPAAPRRRLLLCAEVWALLGAQRCAELLRWGAGGS